MDIDKIIREVTKEIESNPSRDTVSSQSDVDVRNIPAKLEHSLLVPDIKRQKILDECAAAIQYGFATVVVSPYYVPDAAEALLGTRVAVCTAVGFPYGTITAKAKTEDVKQCILMGASEIDVAVNMQAVKSGNMDEARREFDLIMNAAQGKAIIKAVFEHSIYTEDEKLAVLQFVKSSGAQFVKIQNVLSGKAASTESVQFVRNVVGRALQIKIDGGVKTMEHAVALFAAGADRIGLTASIEIAKACVV